jgi:two-component system phosphate regulon sensor histidine kinase PhoR
MYYPLAQHGFELRVEIDDSLPIVAADSDAIQQAILNLLSNAMKYSGTGRVIDLHLRKDARHAVIDVTDRGLGISPGDQSRIFDKFYRVATAENRLITGTGLGLTLVEHVSKAHGGTVTVRSRPGEGSTFSIAIPLSEIDAAAPSAARALATFRGVL